MAVTAKKASSGITARQPQTLPCEASKETVRHRYRTGTETRTDTDTHRHRDRHRHAHTHKQTQTHTHTHTHTHTNRHTHTHTQCCRVERASYLVASWCFLHLREQYLLPQAMHAYFAAKPHTAQSGVRGGASGRGACARRNAQSGGGTECMSLLPSLSCGPPAPLL